MKRPASARAVAKAKGKTTTKGIGKGKGKGEKGNGNGKGKIDDDAAARAAIRAEADAIGESDIEAIMFEARTRENMMFVLDMHLLHSNHNHHGEYALPRAAAATIRARRLSMELGSRDRNAD
jgi:hypothetical protein